MRSRETGSTHTENDSIRLLTNRIDLQWHPATYFIPNSPPAATSACSNSIICMGASWLAIMHRGRAGLCNSAYGWGWLVHRGGAGLFNSAYGWGWLVQ